MRVVPGTGAPSALVQAGACYRCFPVSREDAGKGHRCVGHKLLGKGVHGAASRPEARKPFSAIAGENWNRRPPRRFSQLPCQQPGRGGASRLWRARGRGLACLDPHREKLASPSRAAPRSNYSARILVAELSLATRFSAPAATLIVRFGGWAPPLAACGHKARR